MLQREESRDVLEHVLGAEAWQEHELLVLGVRVRRGDVLGLVERRGRHAPLRDDHGLLLRARLRDLRDVPRGLRSGGQVERNGELERRCDADAVIGSGRKDVLPRSRERCVIETVAETFHDANVGHLPLRVDRELEDDLSLDPIPDGVLRIDDRSPRHELGRDGLVRARPRCVEERDEGTCEHEQATPPRHASRQ